MHKYSTIQLKCKYVSLPKGYLSQFSKWPFKNYLNEIGLIHVELLVLVKITQKYSIQNQI